MGHLLTAAGSAFDEGLLLMKDFEFSMRHSFYFGLTSGLVPVAVCRHDHRQRLGCQRRKVLDVEKRPTAQQARPKTVPSPNAQPTEHTPPVTATHLPNPFHHLHLH